jgi:hypothetical protein
LLDQFVLVQGSPLDDLAELAGRKFAGNEAEVGNPNAGFPLGADRVEVRRVVLAAGVDEDGDRTLLGDFRHVWFEC